MLSKIIYLSNDDEHITEEDVALTNKKLLPYKIGQVYKIKFSRKSYTFATCEAINKNWHGQKIYIFKKATFSSMKELKEGEE